MTTSWTIRRRLIATLTAIVALTLLLFVLLALWRLEAGSGQQARAAAALAQRTIAASLADQAHMVERHLDEVRSGSQSLLSAIASQPGTAEVIASRNTVSIQLLLSRAIAGEGDAPASALDRIVVLDHQLLPVGSAETDTDLLTFNRAFAESDLAADADDIARNNDRDRRRNIVRYTILPPPLMRALGFDLDAPGFVAVGLQPVFDEFGDLIAVLAGFRRVDSTEPRLQEVAKILHVDVQVFGGNRNVLKVGTMPVLGSAKQDGLFSAEDGSLSLCSFYRSVWTLCVLKSTDILAALENEMAVVSRDAQVSLANWLAILAVSALLFSIVVTALYIRQLMAPLVRLASAVKSVAMGNWLAHVAGTDRSDEVGEIARAVAVLQSSMKEREKLKADVADAEDIRRQRTQIARAIKGYRKHLRSMLFSVSDLAEEIELNARELESLSSAAEGEADEARLVVRRAFATVETGSKNERAAAAGSTKAILPAQAADASISRLSDTVELAAQQAGKIVVVADAMIHELRGLDRSVKVFVGDLEGGAVKHTLNGHGRPAAHAAQQLVEAVAQR